VTIRKPPSSQSGTFDSRVVLAFVPWAVGVVLALLGFGVYPGTSALAQGTNQSRTDAGRPQVVPMVGPVSQDQDLRSLPYIAANAEHEEQRLMRHPRPLAQSRATSDPIGAVRQSTQAVSMPTPSATFPGITSAQSGCACLPPDTDGDVGPNHYIQAVNSSIKIIDKAGNELLAPTTYNSFFSALGPATPCGNNQNDGDGFVFYDHLADRWVVSDFAFPAFPGTSFYQCIGVSKTNDPVAGGWWLYALQVDPANPSYLGDYPKFGLWPDAYYLTVNLFSNNTTFNGVRVFALPRTAMINGTGAPTPGAIAFTIAPATLGDAYSLVPARFRTGNAPPAGASEYFLAINSSTTAGTVENQVFAWRFHVDFINPANSTFGVGAGHAPNDTVTVNGFVDGFTSSSSNIVPQNGTPRLLDTLGDKLMTPLVYQNLGGAESLYAAHTVNNNQNGTGPTAIRWYQFDVTGGTIPAAPLQQQSYNNGADGLWRWMPSIAVDAQGDVAIGYSVSSSTTEPAIKYAGRLASDSPNLLAQGEALLIAGGGHQTSTSGRWGDYSALSVDPADNFTFWHTNEYYSATSSASWNTRIGKFSLPVPNIIVAGGSAIVSAGPNGIPDPGETVTVSLGVLNVGAGGCTTALNGTFQATGGVTNPPPTQNYGAVCTGGGAVFRDFTFTVDPSWVCGSPITASLVMTDGVTTYGTLAYTFNTGTPFVTFSQNFDGGATLPAGWTTSNSGAETPWTISPVSPNSAPNDAFAPDPSAVGQTELVTPSIAIPPSGGQLTFKNLYNMETSGGIFYDGMVLEISIAGGPFTDIITAGGSFSAGGYNGTISSAFSSPIAGRSAWSGLSGGTTTSPTYITSTVTLPAAAAGQSVKLKWRAATDSSVSASGSAGVRIDDVSITAYRCAPIPVSAASRKSHIGVGDFNIDLPLVPLAGNIGIECRSDSATNDYQLVITFAAPVTVNGNPQAQVTSGVGQVGTGGVSNGGVVNVNGSVVTVPLTGVANAQRMALTLFGVNDGTNLGDVVIPIGMLLGDVNATRRADSGDVTAVRTHAVAVPDQQTFRFDVNASGRIDAGDVTTTRNATITVLP
jgi:hypothetical protein